MAADLANPEPTPTPIKRRGRATQPELLDALWCSMRAIGIDEVPAGGGAEAHLLAWCVFRRCAFASQGQVAQLLGVSVQTVSNRLAALRWFTHTTEGRWLLLEADRVSGRRERRRMLLRVHRLAGDKIERARFARAIKRRAA